MTDLSPAAQAVLSAADSAHDEWDLRPALAAALRALADHQRPAWDGDGPLCHWSPTPRTRQELRNIAAELAEVQHKPRPNPYEEVLNFYDALAAQHPQAVYHGPTE